MYIYHSYQILNDQNNEQLYSSNQAALQPLIGQLSRIQILRVFVPGGCIDDFPSHLDAFQSYIKTRGQGSRQYKEKRRQQTDSGPPTVFLVSTNCSSTYRYPSNLRFILIERIFCSAYSDSPVINYPDNENI